MSNYFNRAVIDNPLNIKRISGDIPTSTSSSKNVFIILIVFGIAAITLGRVWSIALGLLKSPVITVIVLVIIYSVLIFKTLSVSVFEEKKQKKAYQDLLDNRISDLSVIWEIQDIRETVVNGVPIAYVDYIDGTRSVFLRCVPGPILNLDEDTPKYHYASVETLIKHVMKLGYTANIHEQSESFIDHKALSFYYERMRDFEDKDYIEVFTEQLDTIAYVSEMTSSIHVLYIEISGYGKYKHQMLEQIASAPSVMSGAHIFREIGFIPTKYHMDIWIANDASVPMFDRELLILNKYRGTYNTGSTSVLSAQNESGEVVRQFNPEFDAKKVVRKKSVAVTSNLDFEDIGQIEEEDVVTSAIQIPLTEDEYQEVSPILMSELESTKDSKFIELMYSTKKVKLGE